MFEVIRYRGKQGIYSWGVEQKGFKTFEEALKSVQLCESFHSQKGYKYIITKEGRKWARFFEKNIDKLAKVCYIK